MVNQINEAILPLVEKVIKAAGLDGKELAKVASRAAKIAKEGQSLPSAFSFVLCLSSPSFL
jgi:hypothetical protein